MIMKMTNWSILAAAILVPSYCFAVPRSNSYDGRVEGTYSSGDYGDKASITQASVELRRGGEFDMSIRTNRGRENFTGSWREKDDRTVSVIVSRGDDRRDTGSGTLQFYRDQIDKVSLSAHSNRQPWRVNFTTKERVENNETSKITDRDWKLNSDGNMQVLDRRLRIDGVILRIRQNGEVTIETKGGYGDTFRGRWNGLNFARGSFRITSSRKLGTMWGNGHYEISNGALRSIDFTADSDKGKVTLVIPSSRYGYNDRPERPSYPLNRPGDELDRSDRDIYAGTGTMNINGYDEQIERLSMTEKNDRVSIRVYTRRDRRLVTFDVDISSKTSSRLSGNLKKISTMNGRTSGAVALRFDRAGRIEFLEVRGKVDKRTVEVSFRGD